MAITISHGVKISEGKGGVKKILFDTRNSKLCIKYAIDHGVENLTISRSHGFLKNDLDSILPLKNVIKGLVITENSIDLRKLREFQTLNCLALPDNLNHLVDLSFFPKLKILTAQHSKRLTCLAECRRLVHLSLRNFRSTAKDLTELPIPEKLEELALFRPDIRNFTGVSMLQRLRRIQLWRAVNLESIDAIVDLRNSLEDVQIECCTKLRDVNPLGKMNCLRKLILIKISPLANLSFVRRLKRLNHLSILNTNIIDGNLDHCEGIAFVGVDDRRHYSHRNVKNPETGLYQLVRK